MIKNWTVNTEQKSNFVNSYNYLKDKNRPSHHYTQIDSIWDNSKQILKAFDDRKEYRQANSLRGGGVRKQVTSFVFSLPRDVGHPTSEEWKKMMIIVFKDMAVDINNAIDRANKKELEKRSERPNHKKKPLMPNVTAKDLYDHSVAILHDESASLDKKSHVHVNISNVIKNELIKPITQFAATHGAKKAFNKAVKSVLGYDHTQYVPEREKEPDKPLWASRAEKAQEAEKRLAKAKRSLTVIKSLYGKFKDDVLSWSKLFFTNNPDLKPVTASKAVEVENTINKIDGLSSEIADDFDNHIDNIEIKNTEPLPDTKVSDKRPSNRKKRRRKR